MLWSATATTAIFCSPSDVCILNSFLFSVSMLFMMGSFSVSFFMLFLLVVVIVMVVSVVVIAMVVMVVVVVITCI